MFVYLLIAAELAVLYTVFWYLYAREPESKQRISSDLWGTYSDAPLAAPHGRAGDKHGGAYAEQAYEYVLDQATNHYVRAAEARNLLGRMTMSVEQRLSHLNIRP